MKAQVQSGGSGKRGARIRGLDAVRAIRCAALAFCAAAMIAGSAAARGGADSGSSRDTREVTDELGDTVRVPREAKRIVSLAPNLTEIVYALGEGEHLAGDTDYCDYPPEATRKPHVGGTVNPSLEQIAALKPDVILATSINRRETVEALGRVGLPVFVTAPHSVDGMIASVEHIGGALGVEKSAAALAGDLRTRLADLDHRLAGTPLRSVLFVVWTDPLISVGRDTFIADAMRHAGGRSVVDTSIEWPRVSIEEIVHLQPEVLVFAAAHGEDTQGEIDSLRTRPGWKEMTAVQTRSIVVISDAINRAAPRMVSAIETLARALHPAVFTAHSVPVAPGAESRIEEACACAR